uniref:Radical SAM superfamily enzyme, MoaA/NifB/PqqE/SkfB family n=1 Tax=Candidatus Kentrum sp. FM TaxID=2126340 RepID=A0A450SWT8_9GAMM|nr:MAG: Radical SAM superfamily enzyme, MoaA/NifB/PqqE/SkfB family [Candidatus Kentron sp. FM]VFJ58439.1 MAG: Radical SAM superfamily enzyme, MoaA/NifB/PqqE/SkfB family [Candidatus Kentron sp. FM]VFK12233.1 MAG: Radical SAM superfamily enzyme, MoaA/NifB/PqqE/SkfB family [Candidatus Kentron sp. FM]
MKLADLPLNRHTFVKRDEQVFSRREAKDKLFLLRPAHGKPPVIQLLDEPALSIWTRIENAGATIEELFSFIDEHRCLPAFSYLLHHGFIVCDPEIAIPPVYMESDIEIHRNPWDYQFNTMTLESPWFALWELTEYCPLKEKCLFCYRPDEEVSDPNLLQRNRVIDQLAQARIPWITLLGGEPLACEAIYDIVRKLRSHKMFVKIITNGVLVNEENARLLGEAGLNQIALSLDGLDRELHERSRGKNSFDKTIRAMKLLKKTVPLVTISLTVSNKVFEQLDHLADFCEEHEILEVYISPLRATMNTQFPEGISTMSSEQQAELTEKVASCNRDWLDVIAIRECSCGRSSCVIHCDGTFSPCPFAKKHYGNLYEEDLLEMWSRATSVASRIGRLIPGRFCFRRHELEAAESLANFA